MTSPVPFSVPAWVAELRSGHYKPGQKRLCAGGRYCCMGVALDVFLPGRWELHDDTDDDYPIFVFYDDTRLPPDEVQEAWGLDREFDPLSVLRLTEQACTELGRSDAFRLDYAARTLRDQCLINGTNVLAWCNDVIARDYDDFLIQARLIELLYPHHS